MRYLSQMDWSKAVRLCTRRHVPNTIDQMAMTLFRIRRWRMQDTADKVYKWTSYHFTNFGSRTKRSFLLTRCGIPAPLTNILLYAATITCAAASDEQRETADKWPLFCLVIGLVVMIVIVFFRLRRLWQDLRQAVGSNLHKLMCLVPSAWVKVVCSQKGLAERGLVACGVVLHCLGFVYLTWIAGFLVITSCMVTSLVTYCGMYHVHATHTGKQGI